MSTRGYAKGSTSRYLPITSGVFWTPEAEVGVSIALKPGTRHRNRSRLRCPAEGLAPSKRHHDGARASRIGLYRCRHIVEGLFILSFIIH